MIYNLLGSQFSSRALRNYAEAWRRTKDRTARCSERAIANYAISPGVGTLAVVAGAADVPAEILLYDEIGFWGITAKDFVLALAAAGDGPLTLRINSPGGDVFDGLAIFNALRARKAPVNCVIDGLAASAASFIAMAGTTVSMAEQSMLMIHNAWGISIGDRNDMLDMAAVMEKIDGQLGDIYAKKSGSSAADIRALMDAETWFTATEAKDAKLCDAILVPAQPDAAAAARTKPIATARSIMALSRRPAPHAETDPDDPDQDDGSDAAIGSIQTAMGHLSEALDCLNGGSNAAAARAAATAPEWIVGAAEDLPIDDKGSWDGPAAAERMLDAAGFNGASPDPAKAKRGFLVYDHHNPKLKGSYKLPFADLVGGDLKALKSGLDAAASRLPQTDIPDAVKTRARAVIDAYEKRTGDDAAENRARVAMHRRLRLAEAEAA